MRYNVSMRVISLQSGSNGNCIYVEAGGVKLLIDAGISASGVEERLAFYGRDVANVDAVLISHDHIDHRRSMGILHRKFGLPIYVTTETYRAAKRFALGEVNDLRHFVAGEAVRFGKVTVETIPCRSQPRPFLPMRSRGSTSGCLPCQRPIRHVASATIIW